MNSRQNDPLGSGNMYVVVAPYLSGGGSRKLNPLEIVIVQQGGDCFYDFLPVKRHPAGWVQLDLDPHRVCGYSFNGVKVEGMSKRNYHLLMAGELVEEWLGVEEAYEKAKRQVRPPTVDEVLQMIETYVLARKISDDTDSSRLREFIRDALSQAWCKGNEEGQPDYPHDKYPDMNPYRKT